MNNIIMPEKTALVNILYSPCEIAVPSRGGSVLLASKQAETDFTG